MEVLNKVNNFFLVIFLLSIPALITFGIIWVINIIKKDKLKSRKGLRYAGISFAILVVSFVAVGITSDPVESKQQTKKEEVSKEVEDKEAEEKSAITKKEKEDNKAKAKIETEQKASKDAKDKLVEKETEEKAAIALKAKKDKEAKAKVEAEEKASKDAKDKIAANAKKKKEDKLKAQSLGYDLDGFAILFNIASQEFESSFQIDNLSVTDGEVQDVATIMLNDYIAMNLSINKEDKSVRDILMIGQGDGTAASGLDIMVTIGTIITATNPDLTPDERGDVLNELGLMDEAGLSDEQQSAVRNGVKYTFESSDLIGIMFTAGNSDDK